VFLILALIGLLTPTLVEANAVDDWSLIANQVAVVNANRGGVANIDFAYVHIAMPSTLSTDDTRYSPSNPRHQRLAHHPKRRPRQPPTRF
jgi:hypothetical protein